MTYLWLYLFTYFFFLPGEKQNTATADKPKAWFPILKTRMEKKKLNQTNRRIYDQNFAIPSMLLR